MGEKLKKSEGKIENCVVIGSGPSGSTAALYLARAKMNPLMIAGFKEGARGGQLTTTTIVENFPGFPQGIDGTELAENMIAQAENFGTRVINKDVVDLSIGDESFIVYVGKKRDEIHTKSVIVCSGAIANRLYVPGTHDEEFWQKGVSTCAICDGSLPMFRDKPVAIIGGGDSAMEEAIYMSRYSSEVYIINRSNRFRASSIMLERAKKNKKIKIFENLVLEEVKGNKTVERIILKKTINNTKEEMNVGGVFFAIGHTPSTKFLEGKIELLHNKCIKTTETITKTSVPGLFCAGDVVDAVYRQAIKAAGDGCAAAIDAIRYIESLD